MRIAMAQFNPVLGDFKNNADKIISFSRRAHEKRADLAVFSELALFGYPPYDALERQGYVKKEMAELKRIQKSLPKGLTIVFGAVVPNENIKKGGKTFVNAAVVMEKGGRPRFFPKQFLPSYDVFDETRFFEPGEKTGVISIPGKGRVAVTVCEDMWCHLQEWGNPVYKKNPLAGLGKINLMVNISSSPFYKGKLDLRLEAARRHVKALKVPLVYVNQVGAQDELIFDGRSFILDEKGKVLVQAAAFEEDLVIVDLGTRKYEYRPPEDDEWEVLRKALVLGIRDFVGKTGQKRVHLGLSGGIDSSLVAALAVDALGPGNVTGLLLPGPYSSQGSVDDALALATHLGIKTLKVDINDLYQAAQRAVAPFSQKEIKEKVTLVEQNLQARLRGLVLMAYSNSAGSLLLATSNKSELATGYSTLYGDMDGALMPIGDLVKKEVYALAELYNRQGEIIPKAVMEKAPSAELAPGQKDQDTLPPYDQLDRAVIRLVEERQDPSGKLENWVWQALCRNEFKRWQAPPILKISTHAFGRGRRVPIAGKF